MAEKDTIPAVKCDRCGRLHEANSTTYLMLGGGIHIGGKGEMLGGFEETPTVWCRYEPAYYDSQPGEYQGGEGGCLMKALQKVLNG